MQQPYQQTAPNRRQVTLIPLDQIVLRQDQPFVGSDGASIRDLAASIRRDGLIQPITVRPRTDGRYGVVSGNRRLLACRMCGFSQIEAVVMPGDAQSDAVRQLMDMLLGGALDYLEEAEALHRLCVQGNMARSAIARRLGLPETAIDQRLQLMQLSTPVRTLLQNHHMPSHIAYTLLNVPDEDTRLSIARQAARQHLSVADVDLLVSSALRHPAGTEAATADAAPQPIAAMDQPPSPGTLNTPEPTAADDASPHGRTIAVMRDERLYLNAIRALVSQMQEAGVPAELAEMSYGSRVELTIQLPMTRRRRADKYRMPVSPSACGHGMQAQ